MSAGVVLVHGIRTSASMWRPQVEYLTERGIHVDAVDLPGHGTRRGESFTLEEARNTIDRAVQDAAGRGPVLLVGHSMGGLLSIAYAGGEVAPPIDGFVAAGCTTLPRGLPLNTYRTLIRGLDSLPGRGSALTDYVLARTLPPETRHDFGAGGYAYDAQHVALASLPALDVLAALDSIRVPTWFVNGQYDQLRVNERLFARLVPHAELIVVPRTTHLVTSMRPEVFNRVLDLALVTLEQN